MNHRKSIFTFILLLFIGNMTLSGQIMDRMGGQMKNTVFVDNANVREKPSVNSKVIKTLDANTEIFINYNIRWKLDTINDVGGYWFSIMDENGPIGYLWEGVLASSVFKSQLDIKNTFSVHLSSSNKLSIAIHNSNTRIGHNSFDCNKKAIQSAQTMGRTYNSNGNEVVVVKYVDQEYELFEWNGTSFLRSDVILDEESFITGKYFQFEYAIINGNHVNMRAKPSINSEVLFTLSDNQLVKPIKRVFSKDTFNSEHGFWSEISFKDKTGYIWYKYVDFPTQYIKNNRVENEAFLATPNTLYFLRNDKIVTKIHDKHGFFGILFDAGTLGLSVEYQFLGFRNYAESCGEYGGDKLYLWDGEKFDFFAFDYGVGDGGLSEGHEYVFPIEKNGVKGKILHTNYYGESVSFPSSPQRNEDYEFIYYDYYSSILEYNGDTLVELDSKDKKIKELIKTEYPNHHLKHYIFVENKAIAYIEIKSEDWEVLPTKQHIVVIGLNITNASAKVTHVNKSIVDPYCTGVLLESYSDTSFSVSVVYGVGYDARTATALMERFDYEFESITGDLYWTSKTEAEQEEQYGSWITKTKSFKTNKIKFEDSWSDEEFLYFGD